MSQERCQRDARMAAIAALDDAVRLVTYYVQHHVERPADFVGLIPDLRDLRLRFEHASAPEDADDGTDGAGGPGT